MNSSACGSGGAVRSGWSGRSSGTVPAWVLGQIDCSKAALTVELNPSHTDCAINLLSDMQAHIIYVPHSHKNAAHGMIKYISVLMQY